MKVALSCCTPDVFQKPSFLMLPWQKHDLYLRQGGSSKGLASVFGSAHNAAVQQAICPGCCGAECSLSPRLLLLSPFRNLS